MFLESVNIKRSEEFLLSNGRKLLFYHKDADGVTSAALILKFFPEFKAMPREGPMIDEDLIKRVAQEMPSVVCFVDLPVDQEWKKLLKITSLGIRILIIDHHAIETDMNSNDIVHINPRLDKTTKEVYMSTSCIIYNLFEKMGYYTKPIVWISAIGIIGDYSFKDCGDVLKECKDFYPDSFSYKNPFKSKIGTASKLISSAVTLKGLKGAQNGLRLIMKSKNYNSFIESPVLKKWDKIVKDELDIVLKDFEKNKEVYEDVGLIMYELKTKMNMTAVISTILSPKYPNYVLIIRKRSEEGWKVSLRYQEDGIDVGEMAKMLSKGIGLGGGHKHAAGALITDWNLFKKRVLKLLKSNKR